MEKDKYKPIKVPINGYTAIRPAGPNDQRIDPIGY